MPPPNDCHEPGILTRLREEAIRSIQAVLDKPPRERHQVVDFGERAAVRLRDCLIEHLRQETAGGGDAALAAGLRVALDQVNVALSLLTGVEYPGTGLQEKPIQQALDILRLLDFSFAARSVNSEGPA